MRVGAAYTQTGVLAKGRAKGSAGDIEELGRELGLAGACPPPQGGGPPRGGDRHASPLAGDPRGGEGLAQRARFRFHITRQINLAKSLTSISELNRPFLMFRATLYQRSLLRSW